VEQLIKTEQQDKCYLERDYAIVVILKNMYIPIRLLGEEFQRDKIIEIGRRVSGVLCEFVSDTEFTMLIA
jgi:hypothetical protein